MSWKLPVLLLVVVGVTTAYVAPDDQGRYSNGQRSNVNTASPRAKPRSLAAQHAEQGAALRAQEGAPRRRGSRDVGTGAYSTAGSGAGGGVYQQSNSGFSDYGYGGYGAGGNPPFPFYPFHNQNPQAFAPVDFASFFQYLQQMQNNFQQNALNQGLTKSYGIATRQGVFGPSGYITSSSNSFSGPGGNGYGGGQTGGGGGYGGSYGNGASAVASLGPQGGFGSAQLTPDLGNRFGGQSGELPPPRGGGPVGVFTSSSSGSSNINGHETSYKEATSSINDNGKITTFTVRDPPNSN